MITETAIKERFLDCLSEINEPLTGIAGKIDSSQSYLSQLRSKKAVSLRAVLIAAFCKEYGYSLNYILFGEGDKRAKAEPGVLDAIYEELKKSNHIQGEIIKELLNAILQVGPKYLEAKAELIQEAKKRSN